MKNLKFLFLKTLMILATTWCLQGAVFGQSDNTVTGSVKSNTGMPLSGVTVTVKNGKAHDISNDDGSFSIKAAENATLVFSYIGYQNKEMTATSTFMDVVLQPVDSTSAGNDVVVTAYGIKKQNKNLGYAVTTVSGEDVTRTNTVNPIAALQGKVAGVQINVMESAGVQTSPYIQIRGAKVIGGNNQPIFVVDGNILQNNLVGGDAADGGSQLLNLNPDDYESITVLKGAAATAIYGSRGLNGAVVITTKSGKAGKGIGIEYSTTYQTTNAYKPFMDLQNEFGMGWLYREGAFAPDGSQTRASNSFGPAFDGKLHPAVYNPDTMVAYTAQPDNWKAFYQNGNYVNNNVTLSGGSDKYNYRISYTNTYNKGILPKNTLNRNAVDIKLGGEINKVFSMEMGLNYANTVTTNRYNQSRYFYSGGSNLGFNVYYMPRNTDFDTWRQYYRNPDNSVKSDGDFGYIVNAFSSLDKNNFWDTQNSLLAYLQIKAQVSPWLDLSAKGNINYLTDFTEEKDYGNGANNSGGAYGVSGNHSANYNLLFSAHAATKAMNNDLSIDFRLINEYYGDFLSESYSAATNGGLRIPNQFLLDNSVNNVTQGYINYGYNDPTTGSFVHNPRFPSQLTIGVGGDLNLNYKSFLNLELTARNDWLSTLTYPTSVGGANNYSVFYPSANLSYVFYDQFKDKMPSWLSAGQLRASLAYVGNAGAAGPWTTGYGYQPSSILNAGNATVPIVSPINGSVKPNPDLKPQRQRSWEFGTNLGFLHNLVTLDFTYYKTNTMDQLINLDGVMETGYNKLYINAGNVQNQGIEVLLDVNPIRNRDWNLDFAVNMGHNKGKLVKLYPGLTKWNMTGDYEGAQVWSYEGGPYGQLMVRGNTAFKKDPKTGYPIVDVGPFYSATGDNKVNAQEYPYEYYSGDTLINMGNIEPKLTGGFTASLRYKNFSLFAQLDGRFGGMTYSESYTYGMAQGSPATSLKWRDQAHGGEKRINSYDGSTVYDGAVPNVVFGANQKSPLKPGTDISGMTFREAYDKGLVDAEYAPLYYALTYDWENGLNSNGAVSKETWIMFREITLSYQLPASLLQKSKVFTEAKLSLTARNLGYLYNSLPANQNPASIQSNDPNYPYITGGVPFTRSFAVSLNVKF